MPASPITPAVEEVMTMLPPLPRSRIAAITYFSPNHTPRTFTAMTRSKSSTAQSTIGSVPPSMPALASNASTAP